MDQPTLAEGLVEGGGALMRTEAYRSCAQRAGERPRRPLGEADDPCQQGQVG